MRYIYIIPICMVEYMKRYILFLLPIVFVLAIHLGTMEIVAQRAVLSIPTIQADYAVNIVPGAAQRDSTYHFYPPKIAIPTDTTVAWFNLDYGQPHTVTSGIPGDADRGLNFNSGVLPLSSVSHYTTTFSQDGEYPYFCIIHPWRVASVSVSDARLSGSNFEVGLGSGHTWDISTHPRVLLEITPKTVQLDGSTPIIYNLTINDYISNQTIFSDLFTTSGTSLPIELVSGVNETSSYGPDFSTSGTYHIQSDFKKGSSYQINVEIVAIDNGSVSNPIRDTFTLQTRP
jgi:plastocyanin